MTEDTFDPHAPWLIDIDARCSAAISAEAIDEECNIREALKWWVSGLEPRLFRHAISGRLTGIGHGDEIVIRIL